MSNFFDDFDLDVQKSTMNYSVSPAGSSMPETCGHCYWHESSACPTNIVECHNTQPPPRTQQGCMSYPNCMSMPNSCDPMGCFFGIDI